MKITIREATERDVDVVVAMAYALHRYHHEIDDRAGLLRLEAEETKRKKYLDAIADVDSKLLVAVDETDTPIGMALGEANSEDEHHRPPLGRIESVYVNESVRGNGVGRKLTAALCDFFKARDVNDISLIYIMKNAPAKHFWTGLGFQPFALSAKAPLSDVMDNLTE